MIDAAAAERVVHYAKEHLIHVCDGLWIMLNIKPGGNKVQWRRVLVTIVSMLFVAFVGGSVSGLVLWRDAIRDNTKDIAFANALIERHRTDTDEKFHQLREDIKEDRQEMERKIDIILKAVK